MHVTFGIARSRRVSPFLAPLSLLDSLSLLSLKASLLPVIRLQLLLRSSN
jgi:hypothetical protein